MDIMLPGVTPGDHRGGQPPTVDRTTGAQLMVVLQILPAIARLVDPAKLNPLGKVFVARLVQQLGRPLPIMNHYPYVI